MALTLRQVSLKVLAQGNSLPGDSGLTTPGTPSNDLHLIAIVVARRSIHLRIGPDGVVAQNLVHRAHRLYECGPILRGQIAQIDDVTRDGLAVVRY